ncbi:RICIN domain-containing protein [Kitasatospora sp. NPDC058243]|uniref:RICIN domain-containing protein n=1 Tax=Kitasatospora sp. NPDC058243 TaxID=3346397 RepID=UPI0036D9C01D
MKTYTGAGRAAVVAAAAVVAMLAVVPDASAGTGWGKPIEAVASPGKCLDVRNGSLDNGTSVEIWDCTGGWNQKWDVDFPDGRIKVSGTSKCLDLPAGNSYNGAKLEIWDCNGGSNQQWNVSLRQFGRDNTDYWMSNRSDQGERRCADKTDGGSWNGNPVQVWDCDNNNLNQGWRIR